MKKNLDIVTKYAKINNKIPILAETGLEGIKVLDYYTGILLPIIKPYDISYVLFWRNAFVSSLQHHFYVPFAGHPATDDFRKFAGTKTMLMSKDVHNLYMIKESIK
jgi:hypothetical protein